MKGFPILVFSAISAACFAQTSTGTQTNPASSLDGPLNESLIAGAYTTLQTAPALELTLTGTETVNGHQRSFTSYLWWNMAADPRNVDNPLPPRGSGMTNTTAQVLLEDYDTTSNPAVLENCYVGDGKTLWYYARSRGTYSATFYSFYGTTQPTGYAGDSARLLAKLYPIVQGQSAYLVRLLTEINPNLAGAVPSYLTWAPSYLAWQPASAPPTVDPLIPSRVYADSVTEAYVLYNDYSFKTDATGKPLHVPEPTRSVAFQLDEPTSDGLATIWSLSSISFADEGVNRLTNFTIDVANGAIPPAVPQNYPFILSPPKGATTGAFTPWPTSLLAGYQPISPPKTLSD